MAILIFFDANFLFVPVQLQLDVYSELDFLLNKSYEIIIISSVLEELEKKYKELPFNSKFSRDYRVSRDLLQRKKYRIHKLNYIPGKLVDDILLEVAQQYRKENQENQVYIATNDKELRKKCRFHNIHVIYIRQGKKIAVE